MFIFILSVLPLFVIVVWALAKSLIKNNIEKQEAQVMIFLHIKLKKKIFHLFGAVIY